MRTLCPESPDVDVTKKTANAPMLGYMLYGPKQNGVTTNWLDQWSDDHVSKLQIDDPSLKAIFEILQNEEDNLDPVYRTNFEIRQLWNLKDTLVVKGGILYRQ